MSDHDQNIHLGDLPFGLDYSTLAKLDSDQADKRVCACGHPVSQHGEPYPGFQGCFPPKSECLCKSPKPVLEVSDKRFFTRRTIGWGEKHALSRGLFGLVRSGGVARSLVGNSCGQCGQEVERLIPTSLSETLSILESPGVFNALLCPDCWSAFPISPGVRL
jgi:hypothetical protein